MSDCHFLFAKECGLPFYHFKTVCYQKKLYTIPSINCKR